MPSILNRIQSGWNAFMGRDPTNKPNYAELGSGSSYRPDRARFFRGNDKSIVSAVICRIGMDAAAVDIKHVRVENDRYVETINSKLNNALTCDANIDQTGRAFIQDVVMSMCDEGHVVIVPTDTTTNPYTGSYDISELRTGRVMEWYPKHVRVEVYNENTGRKEQLMLPKSLVAIVENPLYSVMNEPNSTLQRLKRVLNNLDILNERNASGKLDLIIQLPYVIKSQSRRDMAEERRKEIEMQLVGSKYGIAYTDGTERITQLNRPLENNYWTQAKELTSMLYNQLGLTEAVFDGTADERAMNNYYTRTIEPILSAVSEEMERKFLTKTARSQGQAIKFFRDPFRLVTIETVAQVATAFISAEIASPNEMRTVLGWKPDMNASSDELRNRNINATGGEFDPSQLQGMLGQEEAPEGEEPMGAEEMTPEEVEDRIAELEGELDELYAMRSEFEEEGDEPQE